MFIEFLIFVKKSFWDPHTIMNPHYPSYKERKEERKKTPTTTTKKSRITYRRNRDFNRKKKHKKLKEKNTKENPNNKQTNT